MIAEEIRAVIAKRSEIPVEWEHFIEQCWLEEIEILSRNINDTIDFLENECTAEEFSWLDEVFDDVAEKTKSRRFVDCLYRVADKYSKELAGNHVVENLKFAEMALNTD